jgi:glyoxylase-like metal-dependent hydrolase (beta-lactamase superfamily II)
MVYQFGLGDARITPINAGDIQYDLARSLHVAEAHWPEAYRADFGRMIHIPQQTALIRIGRSVIVVDAGHPIMPPGCESFAISDYAPPPPVHTQLAQHGVQAEDVTHVIITHAHFDHYAGLCDEHGAPCFPNARHYLGRADWELDWVRASLRDPDTLESNTFGVIRQCGLLELIDGDLDLGDGVSILDALGETPGHHVVRAHSQGRTLYVIGDLYHHEVEVLHPNLQAHWGDVEAMRASRDWFTEAALREDALIIAAHIRGIGRLQRATNGVAWRNIVAE